ncbi:MAG TPA: leucyl/phenylalanyl-tRNA--protein transferase [Rhizomicrobium sp.]|nr:leucyl/phenylalanyl-tRNA--protein transferase [Rhizomicrobium sp.]
MHGRAQITTDMLLQAYAEGIFPMAERREDEALYWVSPDARGVIPLDRFHVSRRLARTVRSDRFRVTLDRAFGQVIAACAAPGGGDRRQSWINGEIVRLYSELHAIGHAHSVECWRDGVLAGGLYGVSLGGAFFGESMFSRERDASKVALVHLVARLKQGGFTLLDAQFLTAHLSQFGAVEIPRARYLELLQAAIVRPADLYCPESSGSVGICSLAPASGEATFTLAVDATVGACWPGRLVMQLITQTS